MTIRRGWIGAGQLRPAEQMEKQFPCNWCQGTGKDYTEAWDLYDAMYPEECNHCGGTGVDQEAPACSLCKFEVLRTKQEQNRAICDHCENAEHHCKNCNAGLRSKLEQRFKICRRCKHKQPGVI